ncbi:hypothetical protein [Methylobacterium sp. ID0610]|uniref:hypothetical protein n=1 Tax=Methylobacterium carpenticola TaxID=3344827 RepID=UPI0036AFC996
MTGVCESILRNVVLMARRVTYQILDGPDGRFTVAATMKPDKTVFRTGFTTLAEAEDWVEDLRVIMAAVGAPVSLALPEHPSPLPVDVLLALVRKH